MSILGSHTTEEMEHPTATYNCLVLAEGQTYAYTGSSRFCHPPPTKSTLNFTSFHQVMKCRKSDDLIVEFPYRLASAFFALWEWFYWIHLLSPKERNPSPESSLFLTTLHLLLSLPVSPYLFSSDSFQGLLLVPSCLSSPTLYRWVKPSQSLWCHEQICGIYEKHYQMTKEKVFKKPGILRKTWKPYSFPTCLWTLLIIQRRIKPGLNTASTAAGVTATYLAASQVAKLHSACWVCNANHGMFCNGNVAPKRSS